MNSRRAFTLIELLVVIGLIALLVGGLTLALGDTGVTSLATAQNTLATLVGTARAQAAVKQTEARLLIYATRPPTGDTEKYLRYFRVVIANTPGVTATGATWTAIGAPVSLPRGVFVVPTSTTGLLATGVVWPANPAPTSIFISTTAASYSVTGDPATTAADTYFAVEFAPNGAVLPTAPKLAVATATVVNGLPQFDNAGAVRGLVLRSSGAVTRVNDAGSF
jgi:prepilin-type N-terminal cleavage/methylation domain-containing protein